MLALRIRPTVKRKNDLTQVIKEFGICNLELLTHHKMNGEEGKERNYENSLYDRFMKTKITKAWDGNDIT